MGRQIVQGFAKNTGVLFLQQIITWASTFFLMLFLPRYLGPKEYGTVFLGTSISAIFGIIVSYGGSYYVAKAVSRDPNRTAQIMVDASAFRVALWFIASLGSIIFCMIADYSWHDQTVIYIFVGALLFQGPSLVIYSCFQGREKMQFTSRAIISEKVFVSLVGVLVLIAGAGAVTFAVVRVVGSFINFLLVAIYSREIIESLPVVNWRSAWNELKEGIPYFMFMAFSSIYYRVNSVILSKTVSGEVLGWFGAAMRFFETMNFFPFIITTAIYPVFSRLWKDEASVYRKASLMTFEFILIVGLPVSVFTILFARDIVSLLYGIKQYAASIPVLQILAGGAIFLFVNMILGTMLISSDRQRQQSYLTLGAIFVSIGLNLLFIPLMQRMFGNGGIGAALSTALIELMLMIAMLLLLPRGSFAGFQWMKLIRIILATAISGFFAFGLMEIGIYWILSAIVGLIAYVPLIRFFKGIDDNGWKLVIEMIRSFPLAHYIPGIEKQADV